MQLYNTIMGIYHLTPVHKYNDTHEHGNNLHGEDVVPYLSKMYRAILHTTDMSHRPHLS
jgi:hypothetical protein